jgi:hypothetical protein
VIEHRLARRKRRWKRARCQRGFVHVSEAAAHGGIVARGPIQRRQISAASDCVR